ncbi:DUF2000 domain-containing protein [Fusobacterium varium]|jgi:hypothetical protein
MNEENSKCVIIVDEKLPLGIIVNTSSILGITLGKHIPELVGKDVQDDNNKNHLGIIKIPVPILRGNKNMIRELREKLYTSDFEDIITVDFSDVAQSCKTYDEFEEKFSKIPEKNMKYFGIALCGNKKKINKLTGNIPLLR